MSSGSVGVHVLPVMIGNVICGVLIWITNGREKWKVCIIVLICVNFVSQK